MCVCERVGNLGEFLLGGALWGNAEYLNLYLSGFFLKKSTGE